MDIYQDIAVQIPSFIGGIRDISGYKQGGVWPSRGELPFLGHS